MTFNTQVNSTLLVTASDLRPVGSSNVIVKYAEL